MVENEMTNETLINVPLRAAKKSPVTRRADSAIEVLKETVARNVKIDPAKIWIDSKVNEIIWSRGRKKIPSLMRIKVIKLQDGTAEIILP
ncbi:50S ribosomal protein L31e [Thermoplasmatales archaeon AK]|nr:50S ribosomal protein L31e [Thermoplasmatales archaeon AK]